MNAKIINRMTEKQLAILGGKPCFKEIIHVSRPFIPDKNIFSGYLEDIFTSRFLTNSGRYQLELEEKIALLHHVKYCAAVANGTLGLQLTIKALGLKGEVIIPAFTFIATAHSVTWEGLKAVFCDIDSKTLNIDPDKAERLINRNTSAIIGVHVYGNPCDTEMLEAICKRKGLKLIFDSAHAFLCSKNGKMIGNFGNAEVLSFHATKLFSTFEGGAVLTNDEALYKKIKLLRNFGFTGYNSVESIGINAKLNEVSAAFGLVSLVTIRERISRGRQIYNMYKALLEEIPGIYVHSFLRDSEVNYQYFPIFVNETEYGLSRDTLYKILWTENIRARRYFYPSCHKMEPYCSMPDVGKSELTKTEEASSKILCLPTYFDLKDEEVLQIAGIIKLVHKEREEIKACLKTA